MYIIYQNFSNCGDEFLRNCSDCKQIAKSRSEENKKLVDRQMGCLVRVSTEQGL